MDVGVRDLKQHLSEHLRRVAGGEVIRITDRGVPVATLSPIAAGDPLQRGVDEGWIRPPSRTGLIGENERFPAPVRILDVLREDRDS
ncbi:MAG: type II toxin-antitoxin system prevent-host-death family antitoxin [Actinomycetota bacterium]|nr:type II toxin-antitoxin system prevent-host-death family antitoxin [Actinomycetota bacterium]MDA2972565.1 type II toxin-antitoxin system prevent-host-death family antitoxin [Actinomycetota bacterium]MDA3000386.1 type II toxin-antitoxin system prevent-host-death family antitoxin [Actinomycetota bacterium]